LIAGFFGNGAAASPEISSCRSTVRTSLFANQAPSSGTRDRVARQELTHHCTQLHWAYRLVQQMVAAFLRLAQPFRRGVPTDKESRDRNAE
jgi:hypothetical protein